MNTTARKLVERNAEHLRSKSWTPFTALYRKKCQKKVKEEERKCEAGPIPMEASPFNEKDEEKVAEIHPIDLEEEERALMAMLEDTAYGELTYYDVWRKHGKGVFKCVESKNYRESKYNLNVRSYIVNEVEYVGNRKRIAYLVNR
jgi:hypothetical protein